MNVKKVLEDKLLGTFISRFGVGDSWELYFEGYWLMAQNIIFTEENIVNEYLFDIYDLARHSVDKEYISKCAIVAANMRKLVIGIELDAKCNLTISFENGSNLLIPSSEEIVDWQWCINQSGSIPYNDYLIACFWEGEIQINTTQV